MQLQQWRVVCSEMNGHVRFRVPIAEEIFLQSASIRLDHERCSSIMTPRDLASLT